MDTRAVRPASGRGHTSTGLTGLILKITLLAVAAAVAGWAVMPLIGAGAWLGVGVVAAATVLIFWVYLSPRKRLPLKYLVPGTLLLLAFQVAPVLYTVSTSVTNFGDGHRGTKAEAVTAIESASIVQVPGSPAYDLAVADDDGDLVFILSDPDTGAVWAGDADGLTALDPAAVTTGLSGKITEADGYDVLTTAEAAHRGAEIDALIVPAEDGAIRANGLSRAYLGTRTKTYDPGCDCIRDTATGRVWTADDENGYFTDAAGENLPQGWRVDVGLDNFLQVFGDDRVRGPFVSVLWWNFAFATLSVLCTFALGLLCALALNKARLRFKRLYRTLIVLPYAMPAFAMLLVWRDMFNEDFGLVNGLLGLDVGWFSGAWTARFAVILVQLWLGFPYMFLVSTGALQAIPAETLEAARIDGASGWQAFRRVTLPLLLVALTPLLISSFAFNFNNANAVLLTTSGGPFEAGESTAGATDLLITYTYRLAFGGQGAQYGLAAAVSMFIFLIVATVSVIGFRRTRAQEEVYR